MKIINSRNFNNFEIKKHIHEELQNLQSISKLNCPYIIKYYDSKFENNNLFIFQEYCDNNLFQILKNYGKLKEI